MATHPYSDAAVAAFREADLSPSDMLVLNSISRLPYGDLPWLTGWVEAENRRWLTREELKQTLDSLFERQIIAEMTPEPAAEARRVVEDSIPPVEKGPFEGFPEATHVDFTAEGARTYLAVERAAWPDRDSISGEELCGKHSHVQFFDTTRKSLMENIRRCIDEEVWELEIDGTTPESIEPYLQEIGPWGDKWWHIHPRGWMAEFALRTK